MSTEIALRTRLINAQQAHAWITSAYQQLKPWLLLGHAFRIEIKPARRSLGQNALLHAMLDHIAKNQEWAGAKRSAETWKRLLMAAWFRATGRSVELLPALDGHGVDIVFARTSELTKAECNELLEFIFAWGCENDIHLPAREHLGTDA